MRLPVAVAHAFARTFSAGGQVVSSNANNNDRLKLAVCSVLAPYAVATRQVEALAQVLEVTGIGLTEADLRTMQQVLE